MQRIKPICIFYIFINILNRQRVRKSQKKFLLVITLNILYIVAQIIGGLLSNSYAIVGDAAHEFTDLTGYFISLISLCVSLRPANKKYTFGFYRFEVLGSVLAVLVMWVFVIILIYEAIERFRDLDSYEVEGYLMFIFAILGIVFNGTFVFIFGHNHDHGGGGGGHSHDHDHEHKSENKEHGHNHKHENNNEHADHSEEKKEEQLEAQVPQSMINNNEEIQPATETETTGGEIKQPENKVKKFSVDLNAAAGQLSASMDVLQSLGIVIASIVIWIEPRAKWLDPACSLFFAVTVLIASMRNIYRALMVLMESVPRGINVHEITSDLMKINGVESVHDLHIWSLTDGVPCCTVHLGINPGASVCRIMDEAYKYFNDTGITHCTIQCEHLSHMLYCAHECKTEK